MIPLLSSHDSSPLTVEDIHILYKSLITEIETALPLPASVSFYSLLPDSVVPHISDVVPGWDQTAKGWSEEVVPVLSGELLLVPVVFDTQVHVVAAVHEVDPELLAKMSKQWLGDLQVEIGRRLEILKTGFVDPETGMYNRRALEHLDHKTGGESSCCILLYIGAPGTSAAVGVQSNRKAADILRAVSNGNLFFLGNRLYAILLQNSARHSLVVKMVQAVQRHLKREGFRRVQVGFAEGATREEMFESSWEAVLAAEKRGPFGVCDARTLITRPFELPSDALLKNLRRQWRGMVIFSVAVFRWEEGTDREKLVCEWLNGKGVVVGSESGHTYVVFSDKEEGVVKDLTTSAEVLAEMGILAVGVCTWPCLQYSKTEAVRCAHKALRHCTFLAPGTGVLFDHLTLNISGDVYFDQGDYHAAARDYRRGLKLEPNDINLLNSLGVTLAEFNQFTAAKDCFRNVLDQQPENFMALVNLGYVEQASGLKVEAMATLEQAVMQVPPEEISPGELLLPLSRLYIEFGRYGDAVRLLEQWAGRKGSENEYILFRLLALCCFQLGRQEQAEAACSKALRLYPHDSVSLSVLGVLYVEGGEGDDIGLRLCRQALEIDPGNPDNYLRFGRALFHVCEYDSAFDEVKKCLQLHPRHPEGLILLARIYMARGILGRAGNIFERVTRLKVCSEEQRLLAGKYRLDIENKKGRQS